MSNSVENLYSVRSRLADEIVVFCDEVIEKLDTTGYSFNNNGITAPIKISTTAIDARVFTREKETKEETGRGRDPEGGLSEPTPHERALAELNEITQFAGERKTKPWSRVFAEAKAGRPLVVIGAPGGGKTTLSCYSVLHRLAAVKEALRDHTSLPEETVPAVWTTCTSLALCEEGEGNDVTDLVINAGFHALRFQKSDSAVSGRVREWIRDRIRSGHCPVVIDSLDEVEDQHRDAFQSRAPRLLDLSSPVVLTCRVMEWGQRSAWTGWEGKEEGPFELASLDAREQRLFVERFFGEGIKRPERVTEMRKMLSSNQALRRTCESPILLFFSCLLHGEGALEGALRRTDLYNLIRRRLFLGEWREARHTPSWVDGGVVENRVTDWLAEIALALFRARPETKVFSLREWDEAVSSPEPKAAAENMDPLIKADALLKDLLKCGFLLSVGRGNDDAPVYSFTHRSLLACLAGRALARREPAVYRREVIEHLWFQPAWEDVILFLAGHIDEAGADALLNAIRKEPEDIFFERLRWEWRIAGEVVSLPPRWGEDWTTSFVEWTGIESGIDFNAKQRYRGLRIENRLYSALGDANRFLRCIFEKLFGSLDPETEENWEFRCFAADALGRIGDARAVERLIPSLDPISEPEAYVRSSVACSLGRIGHERALLSLLESLDPEREASTTVRCSIIDALVKIGDSRSVDPLLSILDTEYLRDLGFLDSVIDALGKIGDGRALNRLINLLESGWSHAFSLEDSVATAIGRIGGPADVRKLTDLLDPQVAPNENVRSSAATALGRIGGEMVVNRLLQCLDSEKERHWIVRCSAADALGVIGDARALEKLLDTLDRKRESSWHVRAAASISIGKIGDERAVEKLIESLYASCEPSEHVRRLIPYALSAIGDTNSVFELLLFCERESDPRLRISSIDALGSLKDLRAFRMLCRSADCRIERNEDVRVSAIYALGEIGDTRALGILLQVLGREDSAKVRCTAASALGRIGDERAIERLLQILRSSPKRGWGEIFHCINALQKIYWSCRNRAPFLLAG